MLGTVGTKIPKEARYEFSTAVKIQVDFWVVTPCCFEVGYHLQSDDGASMDL
jgi:hypothetical protein